MKKILKIFIVILLLCLSSCSSNNKDKVYYTSYKQLENSNIAAWTGSVFETAVKDKLPNATMVNLNFLADMILQLNEGKVEAVSYDKILYPNLKKEFNNITYLNDFAFEISYGTIFARNNHGEELRNKYNEFLAKITLDGRKQEIINNWVGVDEHKYDGLNEWDTSNGLLKVQCGSSTPPFVYICDNEISGYEIALFAEFAKDNKYAVEFTTNEYSVLTASLNAGICDACISGFQMTDENKDEVYFSDSIYVSDIVLYVLQDPNNLPEINDVSQLNGKTIGIITGGVDSMVADLNFPNSEKVFFSTFPDIASSLKNNKIDYFIANTTLALDMKKSDANLYVLPGSVFEQPIAFFFSKQVDRSQKLLTEINDFINNNKDLITKLQNKWNNIDGDHASIEYELTGENGTIVYATNSGAYPYSFLENDKFKGLDIDILNTFCHERGYKYEVVSYDYSGLIQAVSLGKADIGGSGICITDERSEAVDFSVPYNTEGMSAIVRKGTNSKSFFDSFLESIDKNFIREDRWKLILSGMFVTLKISLCSIVFGSILGFIFYMLCRKKKPVLDSVLSFLSSLVDGLPTVVILMILYYVIFGKTSLSGEIVSIVAFTFSFALSVYSMLKTSVKSIDIGQEEAAFSIGFTDIQTFFKIVLPQAMIQFIPNYKTAISSLLKGTAVVGYIAVQDITKVSDLIRARTYEAFFPLIITALVYLILGKILGLLFNRVYKIAEPQTRTKEDILRKYTK